MLDLKGLNTRHSGSVASEACACASLTVVSNGTAGIDFSVSKTVVGDMQFLKTKSLSIVMLALVSCGPTESRAELDKQVESAPQIVALTQVSDTWSLDATSSKIAFASIKADDIVETHYFPGLTGSVAADGEVTVIIPLEQVETRIELRNERMRTLFFETETYPTATIRAFVDKAAFSDLSIGDRKQMELEGRLSLHGEDTTVYVDAFVTRIAEGRVEVSSSEPVALHVVDFKLDAGLEELRKVAGLPSITPSVLVTFTLVFDATIQ